MNFLFWWWLQLTLTVVLTLAAFVSRYGNREAMIGALFGLSCCAVLSWAPNLGPLWKLRDKWRVRRILKKIAQNGGQLFVCNQDDSAKVRAVSPKPAFDEALATWDEETARLTSEGQEVSVRRRTTRVRVYALPTFTFAYEPGYRAPAHSGTEADLSEVMVAVVTKLLGRKPPTVSQEGFRKIQQALLGNSTEPRLLIPFLGKGEHGLTLKEQLCHFGDLRPDDLAKSLI